MSIIEKAVGNLERNKLSSEKSRGNDAGAGATLEKVVAGDKDHTLQRISESSNHSGRAHSVSRRQPVVPPVEVPEFSRAQAAVATEDSSAKPMSGLSQNSELVLPLDALAERGMVTPFAPRSQIAEEFRAIKRPLLRNLGGYTAAPVDNANLIMVTSALQGDGKTFTAINLAISIALEQDKTVLFVDADVAKASAGRLLGIPSHCPGLIDVLENKGIGLADAMLRTNIDNLRVLPAGNVHQRATELLASQSMHELMLEMSSRYSDRVIVFDSPPLLLTTEAGVLASFMGQIAFVVSTDETPQEAITQALERISGDKIIGMVLNKAHERRSKMLGLGYGYGYGYGYGKGYGHQERAAPSESGC